jgi:hypothetical protein
VFGSYRNEYTAFGLILGVSLAFNVVGWLSVGADWIGLEKARTDTNTYAEQECSRQQAERAAQQPAILDQDQASPANPEPAQGNEREANEPDWCDLAAQQSMADSTFGMEQAAWVALFLTAVGIWLVWRTLYYTRETLKEAQAATAVAKQNMAAEQRPWIGLEAKGSEDMIRFKRKNGSIFVPVTMSITNYGRRPAYYRTQAICLDFFEYKERGIRFPYDTVDPTEFAENVIFPGESIAVRNNHSSGFNPSYVAVFDDTNEITISGMVFCTVFYVPVGEPTLGEPMRTTKCAYWKARLPKGSVLPSDPWAADWTAEFSAGPLVGNPPLHTAT